MSKTIKIPLSQTKNCIRLSHPKFPPNVSFLENPWLTEDGERSFAANRTLKSFEKTPSFVIWRWPLGAIFRAKEVVGKLQKQKPEIPCSFAVGKNINRNEESIGIFSYIYI